MSCLSVLPPPQKNKLLVFFYTIALSAPTQTPKQ